VPPPFSFLGHLARDLVRARAVVVVYDAQAVVDALDGLGSAVGHAVGVVAVVAEVVGPSRVYVDWSTFDLFVWCD
jgi:hypothetical protein